MNNTLKILILSDPSHAWGQVPHELIKTLGIGSKISRYSYQDQNYVYLEEDSDLAVFLNACASRDIVVNFDENYVNYDSPIRNKKRFEWGF